MIIWQKDIYGEDLPIFNKTAQAMAVKKVKIRGGRDQNNILISPNLKVVTMTGEVSKER